MFRIFNLGIVLGIALAAALVYFVPVVDLQREVSLITVHANGGNSESFHIRLPDDRIMAGVTGAPTLTPPGLEWPDLEFLANVQTEMFKLRNEHGVVIGAASRMSGRSEQHGSFVEWVLHLPARGTMYVSMAPNPSSNGYREGTLRAGTREFLTMHGVVLERFAKVGLDSDTSNAGRIELAAALVGEEQREDEEEDKKKQNSQPEDQEVR